MINKKNPPLLNWSNQLPDAEWRVYRTGLEAIRARDVCFALGGGLAFSAYSLRWRNTKDMDIYILAKDHEAAIAALSDAGFEDYFTRLPYDRSWSHRAVCGEMILDVLWGMPNHLLPVEPAWVDSGPELDVRGMRLRLLPVEVLIWLKLFVFQRTRCDWPDVLNLLYAQGPTLDWRRLVNGLVGDNRRLFGAVLGILAWMCPDRAGELPDWIWEETGVSRPQTDGDGMADRRRVAMLYEKDWFGPSVAPAR
jgi:hypothetical protein